MLLFDEKSWQSFKESQWDCVKIVQWEGELCSGLLIKKSNKLNFRLEELARRKNCPIRKLNEEYYWAARHSLFAICIVIVLNSIERRIDTTVINRWLLEWSIQLLFKTVKKIAVGIVWKESTPEKLI